MSGIITGKMIVGKPQVTKYYVGGQFSQYSGYTSNNFARINQDGSFDATFNMGTGFDSTVNGVCYDNSNRLIAFGGFGDYNGNVVNNIVRLYHDGSYDNTFVAGSFNSSIDSVAVDSKNRIYVGGFFTTYSGVSTNYIVRLLPNGTIDTSFNIGTGFNAGVYEIVVLPDDNILVGGDFTTYNGTGVYYLVKLSPSGSLISFPSYSTQGFNGNVVTIKLQPDGKILIGGGFSTYDTVNRYYLLRLNSNGTIDTSFTNATAFNSSVRKLDYNGRILARGFFTTYLGQSSSRLIKLNQDSSIATLYGTNFNDAIDDILYDSDKTLAVGLFTTYSGTSVGHIVRLDSDGNIDYSFNSGTGFNDRCFVIKKYIL